jgi:pyruvate dehydrogenase E1 component beta subunit
VASKRTTLSRAYRDGLAEEMERDDSIVVLGTDLYERGGHWAQVTNLGPQFGRDRVRNAPISEAAMVAAGVGAAMNGLRPVVDLNFLDFAFGAMDEIVNQAAKVRYWWGRPVPLVVRGTTGFAGGGAQHNNPIESWFCHVPGLLVAYPSTPWDAKGLIKTAMRGEDPVIFAMHKMQTGARGEAGGPEDLVPFGQAAVRRPGRDVTVVSYSVMVGKALAAADRCPVRAGPAQPGAAERADPGGRGRRAAGPRGGENGRWRPAAMTGAGCESLRFPVVGRSAGPRRGRGPAGRRGGRLPPGCVRRAQRP